MRVRYVLALLCLSTAAAQTLGVGIKGGAPIRDLFGSGDPVYQALIWNVRAYSVGPTVELRLPLGLGVEFDALYKRFDQTGPAIAGGTVSRRGGSWEFPILGKYRAGRGSAYPYLEAGPSFNRLTDVLTTFRSLPSLPREKPVASLTLRGITAGAGVEVRLPVIRVAPGVRYTHWWERWPVPGSDSIDFLVGVSF